MVKKLSLNPQTETTALNVERRGREHTLPRHSTGYSECSAMGWITLLGNIPTKLNKEHICNWNGELMKQRLKYDFHTVKDLLDKPIL